MRHCCRPRSVLVASRRDGSRAGLSPEDACMCEPRPAPAPSNDGHSVSHRQLNVREIRLHPSLLANSIPRTIPVTSCVVGRHNSHGLDDCDNKCGINLTMIRMETLSSGVLSHLHQCWPTRDDTAHAQDPYESCSLSFRLSLWAPLPPPLHKLSRRFVGMSRAKFNR